MCFQKVERKSEWVAWEERTTQEILIVIQVQGEQDQDAHSTDGDS